MQPDDSQSAVTDDSPATSTQNATGPRGSNRPRGSHPARGGNRCTARTRSGQRCRRLCDPATGCCNLHPPGSGTPEDTDLSEHFRGCLRLGCPDDIYDFLGKLLILTIQNRISTRRAAVLAFITSQLMRANTACINHDKLAALNPDPPIEPQPTGALAPPEASPISP